MSTPTPNPLVFAKQVEKKLAAKLEADHKGKVDRPRTHDGVLKTKQLKPGMIVRAYLHGKPCGSEKVVAQVTPIDDGAFREIEFSSAHVNETRPAAYRWYCEALDGAPLKAPARPARRNAPRKPGRLGDHAVGNLIDPEVVAKMQALVTTKGA